MSVAKAEKVLNELQAKHARLIARGVEIGDERAAIAYEAHAAGDAKAEKRLAELHREAAEHASQLAGLDSAIKIAGDKPEKARAHEASRADRESAQALRAEVRAFVAAGDEVDQALLTVAASSHKMREVLTRIHQLGSPGRSFGQLDVIGKNCVLEGLRTSIWHRSFELLRAPHRHRLSESSYRAEVPSYYLKGGAEPTLNAMVRDKAAWQPRAA
jgi:hypothetical protein